MELLSVHVVIPIVKVVADLQDLLDDECALRVRTARQMAVLVVGPLLHLRVEHAVLVEGS